MLTKVLLFEFEKIQTVQNVKPLYSHNKVPFYCNQMKAWRQAERIIIPTNPYERLLGLIFLYCKPWNEKTEAFLHQ